MCSGRGVFTCIKYEVTFKNLKLARKDNIKEISVTHVAIIQVQPGLFVSPNSTNMPVFQPLSFHIVLLILWFSLAIDNPPMTSI